MVGAEEGEVVSDGIGMGLAIVLGLLLGGFLSAAGLTTKRFRGCQMYPQLRFVPCRCVWLAGRAVLMVQNPGLVVGGAAAVVAWRLLTSLLPRHRLALLTHEC